jgi:NADH dehydrogenase
MTTSTTATAPTDGTEHVVIVGGGFAGTTLARALQTRGGRGFRVTLLSEENYTTYNPMLPEVVGSTVLPGQVIAPLRLVLGRGQRFVMGRAVGLDARARRLLYVCGGRECALRYDHLVLAPGARAGMEMVPGLARHAIPLKLIGDAMRIRNEVIGRLEQASQTGDAEERRRLLRFVVIGGGFSGVEVAGEIHDLAGGALRHYPGLDREEMRVTLVHGGDRLLPELRPRLAEKAARGMRQRGIEILFEALAREVDGDGLRAALSDGTERRIEAGTVVSTVGTAPNPLVAEFGLPVENGRIRTRPDMSVEGLPGLWAIGDCAAVPNATTGATAPPTAQFAVREARQLAQNLRRTRDGQPTRPFAFGGLGTLATIGNRRGVAEVLGVPVTGFPAWLLWRAFYLSKMPTLSRRLQIFVAWTWDMLFPSDIAQLRFTSSAEADRATAAAPPVQDDAPQRAEPARAGSHAR